MDSDSKHVLTILGLVACFGAGYFICKGENSATLAMGEKFGVFTEIENSLDGKTNMNFENENIAVQNAVNGYYNTADKYFAYFPYDIPEDTSAEEEETEKPEIFNEYQFFDNIVYIHSEDFFLDGVQGILRYFRDYPTPECDGFIIDLRQNIGGNIDYCISALNNFLSPVDNLLTLNYYDGTSEKNSIYMDSKKTSADVVILVDEKTASAAEIFTAAMKQFYDGNVTIIGTNTYGKGIFQKDSYVTDGEFKYTAGTYTVGTWQCYDGVGISPDIELAMDYDPEIICTDDDIQFRAALDLFK